MVDLWVVAIGASLVMLGAVFAALQELEKERKLKKWAGWKHRCVIWGSGAVAIGAFGSLILNGGAQGWAAYLLLVAPLAFSFLVAASVLWIRDKNELKKGAAATAVAVVFWGSARLEAPMPVSTGQHPPAA